MWSKTNPPMIEGERILLRPLTECDLAMTLNWRNLDTIRDRFFHSDVITPEQHKIWYEAYRHKDDDFIFVIDQKGPSMKSVGQIALYNIDWRARRAEFGRMMIGDAEARGKGLAKEATRVLLRAAKTQLKLVEIYLEVYQDNVTAIAVYEACGFMRAESRDRMVKMELFV